VHSRSDAATHSSRPLDSRNRAQQSEVTPGLRQRGDGVSASTQGASARTLLLAGVLIRLGALRSLLSARGGDLEVQTARGGTPVPHAENDGYHRNPDFPGANRALGTSQSSGTRPRAIYSGMGGTSAAARVCKVQGACSRGPLLTAVHTESLLGNACRQPFPVFPGLESATLKTQGHLVDLSKAVDGGLGTADFADEGVLMEPSGA